MKWCAYVRKLTEFDQNFVIGAVKNSYNFLRIFNSRFLRTTLSVDISAYNTWYLFSSISVITLPFSWTTVSRGMKFSANKAYNKKEVGFYIMDPSRIRHNKTYSESVLYIQEIIKYNKKLTVQWKLYKQQTV